MSNLFFVIFSICNVKFSPYVHLEFPGNYKSSIYGAATFSIAAVEALNGESLSLAESPAIDTISRFLVVARPELCQQNYPATEKKLDEKQLFLFFYLFLSQKPWRRFFFKKVRILFLNIFFFIRFVELFCSFCCFEFETPAKNIFAAKMFSKLVTSAEEKN